MSRYLLRLFFILFSCAASAADLIPENWRELAAGKTITIMTHQHILTLFGSNNGAVEWRAYRHDSGFLWEDHDLSKIASEATLEKYPVRELRFRVDESYAGPVEGLKLPQIPESLSMFASASLRTIPYGAKKVIYMQVVDIASKRADLTAGVMVIAFDDLPLDVLRRVALEDGVLRVIRVKDNVMGTLRGNELIKGSVNNPMLVQQAIIEDVNGQTSGVTDPQLINNGGSLGAQVGGNMTGGMGGAAAGGLIGSVLLGIAGKLALPNVYQVSYKLDGEDIIRTSLQGPWFKDIQPGDRVKATRGSFYDKLEKGS